MTRAERAEIRQRYAAAHKGGKKPVGFVSQIAKEFDVSNKTVSKIVNGFNFATDKVYAVDGQFVTGTSVLTDSDGKEILRWTKASRNMTPELARAMVDGFKQELRPAAPKPKPITVTKDYLAAYVFGDPHIGMYAWKPETGDDFDLDIAERDFKRAIDRLIASTPACEQALFVSLGDLFHSDFLDSKTWRSEHVLDTDGRWSKVVQVVVRTIRYCVERLLKKHRYVTVISAVGNHDDHSSLFLTVLLSHVYQNESRINVLDSPTVKHYYRFGNNLIGVHHGHSIKMHDLPLNMANDRRTDWGETKYRYWYTGHIHHETKKEIGGVLVESFRTLAAKDAYAASHGYDSGRDAKCILLHKDYGEVERHTVNVEMVRTNGKK